MTLSLDMERTHEHGAARSRAAKPLRRSSDSRSLMGLDWLSYNLVFALAYPAFCLAELLRRRDAGVSAQTSLFAEARKNEHIALSYAFIARKTLHQFGREDQAKRPS
jgi:hypothetical protein